MLEIEIFNEVIYSLKKLDKVLLLLIYFYLFTPNVAFSQSESFQDTIKVDSVEAERLGLFNDENKHTFKIIFSGKPAKAGLFSLILPGAGQTYNKKYWQVPIVWGLLGYYGYVAINATRDYNAANDAYKRFLKGESFIYEGVFTSAQQLRPTRDKLRLKKERNWVTFSIIYLVQAIQAYIDRHLIDFDLNDDLALKPSYNQGMMNIGLTMNINSK